LVALVVWVVRYLLKEPVRRRVWSTLTPPITDHIKVTITPASMMFE
jgi:hypothetical protein